uniref:Ovule protein n=1 Tax=Globodera pallida TaxID=36090 RepID=A0A183CNH4_GLOPA
MSSSSIAPVLTDEEEESLKRLEMRLTAQLAKVRKSLADEPNQQMKEGQMENESRMEIEPKKAEKKEEKKVEEVPEVKSNKRQEGNEPKKEEKKTCEDVISLDDEVSLGEEETLFDAPKLFEEGGLSFWEACGRRVKTKTELEELRKDEVR